ncbi:uncharacterized protein K02A2.6-like [Ornithodoros turicata]|uniref:uncharacterized protein K02A2.6-like n=1 Tax=Ornithodoros turicata TaxID=34597 RepID=UPI00313A0179
MENASGSSRVEEPSSTPTSTAPVAPVMTSLLPPPKPLDISGDMWKAWKTWRAEYDLFAVATHLTQQPSKVQAATFLVCIGDVGRRIFDTFVFENEADKQNVEVVRTKFEAYMKPTVNLTYHEFVFGKRDQKEGERFDDWLTELRTLARNCEFGDFEQRMLKSRIILGVKDQQLQRKLISDNPSFTKVLECCRTQEMSKERFMEIRKEKVPDGAEVNGLATCTSCGNCGYKEHRSGNCPALGKQCSKCGLRNHFAKVCRGPPRRTRKPQKRNPRKGKKLNEVRVETSQSESDEDYLLCHVSVGSVQADDRWTTEISIEQDKLRCKMDTGANCSVIPLRLVKMITTKHVMKSRAALKTFFGFSKRAVGKVVLEVSTPRKRVLEDFFVVDEDVQTTLSGSLCERLGLLNRVGSLGAQTQNNAAQFDPAKMFEDVFIGLGKLRGVRYRMKLRPGSQGIVRPARKVPLALRDKVKAELQRMEADGVIERVNEPTDWSSYMVVVSKPGKLRICMDPVDLNKALRREHYPMKTLEEVASKLAGAKIFSTLDASSGFWQIPLDEDSSRICTMSTPYGRYRFTRMPFGICTAPEVFQKAMNDVLEGLPHVQVVMDDILVWGTDKEDYDQNLQRLLQRCREVNLKLNLKKCQFSRTEVKYLGHILTTEGLKVDPNRVEDIRAIAPPKNVHELRTFLGMITYVSSFIPRLSHHTSELRELLKKGNAWVWTEVHQTAFEHLKEALTKTPVLAYYQPGKQITLSVDASQYGMGAVVMQEGKPLAYSSRSFTGAQEKYAQIEKEMLAIVHGCKKFHHYIFGQHTVVVETDHKPLQAIFAKSLHECPQRLQRMRLCLQAYSLDVRYRPGKEQLLPDGLSRFPTTEVMDETDEMLQVNTLQELPIAERRLQLIREATKTDEQLQLLSKYADSGWPVHRGQVPSLTVEFWPHREDIHMEDGIVLRSDRVVIPFSMRKSVLKHLHAAHVGKEKMKRRARCTVFWPKLNDAIDKVCDNCAECQANKPRNKKMPMLSHEIPRLPWERVGLDLFAHGHKMYIVMVDFYSFYFEVQELQTANARQINNFCMKVFATHGLPVTLVSDNGPPFSSYEFKQFLEHLQIRHITASPYHPRSNGMAERAVQEAKKLLRRTSTAEEFYYALLEWRNSPRDSVLKSPVQRLMSRQTRTLVPCATEHYKPVVVPPDTVRERLSEIRQQQKKFYDRGTRPLPEVEKGSRVTIYDTNKKTWSPAIVVGHATSPRSYDVSTQDGVTRTRTREHLRMQAPMDHVEAEDSSAGEVPAPPRRSTRAKKQPKRYPD